MRISTQRSDNNTAEVFLAKYLNQIIKLPKKCSRFLENKKTCSIDSKLCFPIQIAKICATKYIVCSVHLFFNCAKLNRGN